MHVRPNTNRGIDYRKSSIGEPQGLLDNKTLLSTDQCILLIDFSFILA